MKLRALLFALICIGGTALKAQEVQFVPNVGQWEQDFDYKMNLKYGALFFEESAVQFVLLDAAHIEDLHGHTSHDIGLSEEVDPLRGHALRMKFQGANAVKSSSLHPKEFHYNFFVGEERYWRSDVPVYGGLEYPHLYDGATLRYYQAGENLKYDWLLSNPASLERIRWSYEGATSILLHDEGYLEIHTPIGSFLESAPQSWGWMDGEKIPLDIRYRLENGQITFENHTTTPELDSLVIDPALIFTSFSGSLTDNWGFSATYDDLGRLYGAGIAFASGYVSTVGAFQVGYNDPGGIGFSYVPDVTISVFNPNGSTLLYATYLGGDEADHPHSLVVNSQGQLIVMGTTSSPDFPTVNPIQSTNAGGPSAQVNGYEFEDSDIFVSRFNATGSALLSSTYLGGSGRDGINMSITENYGDNARGEVVVDENDNMYVVASTSSTDFPSTNCDICANAGGQDAVLFKLNAAGTQLQWANYYGSTSNDAGYSIKTHDNNVYICGGTSGNNLPSTTGAYKSNKPGGIDGYLARFNATTGELLRSTYIGSSAYDQSFIMDVDKLGNVYTFGQTLDANYPISAGSWGTPQYRKQFIHKLSADLSTSLASTAFGSPQGTINLVPTAFNVDDCLNILLSGWGGSTNSGFRATTVEQLPVSADALQSTTNGSDFYFLVLGKNFRTFKYGSYFGGSTSSEHVDGGTSRFDERGRIYQAVCAGCGGNSDLPTTSTAFSPTNNSSNCNLGVIKLDFETGIEAIANIDFDYLIDTNCYELTLRLSNESVNANAYFWDFDQGDTSNLENPVVTFPNLGTYNVMLVAIDTVCDISDTTYINIVHDTANFPTTDWTVDYVDCDLFREVHWEEQLGDADWFEWDFGDGNTFITSMDTVFHKYPGPGIYQATVVARDSFCDINATQTFTINFDDDANVPQVSVTTDSCRYGGVDVFYQNVDSTMLFNWNFSGNADTGMIPTFRYPESGLENVTLNITDTVCNRTYGFNFLADIVRIDGRVYIPSAFTPNGDKDNELFFISGNSCLEDPVFVIYDSWGNEVFRSLNPFQEFWDGTFNGKPVPQDVYTYRFTGGDEVRMGTVTIIR